MYTTELIPHLFVNTGVGAACAKAVTAAKALLALKDPAVDISVTAVEGEGSIALAAAQSAGATALVYLSHAPGISDGHGKSVSVYQPAAAASGSACCAPGGAVVAAAWAAAQAGVSVVLANGKEKEVVSRALAGVCRSPVACTVLYAVACMNLLL